MSLFAVTVFEGLRGGQDASDVRPRGGERFAFLLVVCSRAGVRILIVVVIV